MMINDTTYQSQYVPVSAWVVYQLQSVNGAETDRRRDAPEYYLEEHGMYPRTDGSYQLTQAAPLSREKVQAVTQVVADSGRCARRFKNLIPANLLSIHYCPEVLVWHVKAARRTIKFSLKGLRPGAVNCPDLIFKVVENETLMVYATQSGRLEGKTCLYRAPFPNISNGQVCLGSAREWIKEPTTYEGLMNQWEEIFFDSVFNSDSAHSRAKTPLGQLWKPLLDTEKRFPIKQLIQTTLTLKDLL